MITLDMIEDNVYTIFDKRMRPTNGNFIRINIKLITILANSKFYSKIKIHRHRILSQFIITILTSIIDFIKILRNKDEYRYVNLYFERKK